MDLILNIVVNIFQAFVVAYYLNKCCKRKMKYDKFLSYSVIIGILFVYLEMQRFLTPYEGTLGLIFLGVVIFVLSAILFEGKLTKKIFMSMLIIVLATFAALSTGGLMSIIVGTDYIALVSNASFEKNISMLINQVVLWFVTSLAIKIINKEKLGNNKRYTILIVVLSVIGIITALGVIRIVSIEDERAASTYVLMIIFGIFAIIIASLIMYRISEKAYIEKQIKEMEIIAISRQTQQIEDMKRRVDEVEKVRHEMKKLVNTLEIMLQEKDYEGAINLIKPFSEKQLQQKETVKYTDNKMINYLLGDRITLCNEHNIDIKYFVSGIIDGIEDIDLHCILSNLLDNAIEAVQNIDSKYIELYIGGNEHSVCIEVTNSVMENVLLTNPNFVTTKKEKSIHGFGVKNVRDTILEYGGKIKYEYKKDGKLCCQVILIKDFTTKKGISRQMH